MLVGELLSASDAAVDVLDVQGETTGAYAGTEESATAYPTKTLTLDLRESRADTSQRRRFNGASQPNTVMVANAQSPTGRSSRELPCSNSRAGGSRHAHPTVSQASTEAKSVVQGAVQNPAQGAVQNPAQGAVQNPAQGAVQNPAQEFRTLSLSPW